jgi:hypothetical protein
LIASPRSFFFRCHDGRADWWPFSENLTARPRLFDVKWACIDQHNLISVVAHQHRVIGHRDGQLGIPLMSGSNSVN